MSVRLERVGGWLRLAVDNDGPQSHTRELAHLFEPFYRGGCAPQPHYWGYGAGVAHCQDGGSSPRGDLLGGEPGGRRADLDGAAGLAISLAV